MQILAVGALAAMRSEEGVFTTRQVADLLNVLRLPPVSNLSAALGRLRDQKLVMRPKNDVWSLTPLGDARLTEEAGSISTHTLALDVQQAPGAEFGDRRHTLIPPFLSPIGSASGLLRILTSAPFEQNVMLITRFPKGPEDHFIELIYRLREAVANHGLVLQVASDGNLEDTLWANVVTYMWACQYAIVLLDSADGMLNSNVLIEIGGMLMTGRRCVILRDKTVPEMPTDLVGHIYRPTDLADHAATVNEVHQWIRDDLGLGECDACPSIE